MKQGRSGNVTLNPSVSPVLPNTAAAQGNFNVVIDGGVRPWSPQPSAPWITITSTDPALPDAKTGRVFYSLAANAAGQPQRTGYIRVAGKQFTITQAAG